MGGDTAAHHHLPSWNSVRCSPGMATRTYIRVGGQTAAVHQISRKPKRKVLPHQQLFTHHLLQHNSWVFSPQTWNLLRDLIYTLFPTKKNSKFLIIFLYAMKYKWNWRQQKKSLIKYCFYIFSETIIGLLKTTTTTQIILKCSMVNSIYIFQLNWYFHLQLLNL